MRMETVFSHIERRETEAETELKPHDFYLLEINKSGTIIVKCLYQSERKLFFSVYVNNQSHFIIPGDRPELSKSP